jgi:periplasmic protein TonB
MNAFLNMQLPWSSSILDDKRYYNILTVLAGVMLVVSIIVTITDIPELTRAEKEELPPQLARVILEKKELPPPKPVEPPKEEKKPEEKKPEEKKPEPKPEEKKPEPKLEAKKEVKQPPKQQIDRAKEQAQAEVAQFKDDLADMREMMPTSQLQAANTTSIGQTQATQIDRAMITSGAKVASGGVNSASLSRDVGGVALSGRENTKVKSTLAENAKKANTATAGNSDGEGGAARDRSEISRVMDQHKGAIYQIYNKALRQNATLQGKMIVKIVIDPSGKIVDVSIVSSELGDPELEASILKRIRMISFPPSNVVRTTVNQTFDFLPQ